jgi:hypothetical protein
MVPPSAGLGPTESAVEALAGPAAWLTPARLPRVRAILVGIALFIGLAVWVFHTVVPARLADPALVVKLRGVGVLTCIYALIQMVDIRFYHSRFAMRRLRASGIPVSLHGWLLGQMLAWFGILYYGFTQDLHWYLAGLVLLAISFFAFPIRPVGENS